jgi:hypothetical protein
MQDSKIRSRRKARLSKFSAQPCQSSPQLPSWFVAQMLFGIQCGQDSSPVFSGVLWARISL